MPALFPPRVRNEAWSRVASRLVVSYREICTVEVFGRSFVLVSLVWCTPSAMHYVRLWLRSALQTAALHTQRQLRAWRPINDKWVGFAALGQGAQSRDSKLVPSSVMLLFLTFLHEQAGFWALAGLWQTSKLVFDGAGLLTLIGLHDARWIRSLV